MSRLTGASLSPMVTVSAVFAVLADPSVLPPLRTTAMPMMTASVTTAAMMMGIHLLNPLGFGDLTRALSVASVLAALVFVSLAPVSPCAPEGCDMSAPM